MTCNFFRVICGRDSKALDWPGVPDATSKRFDESLSRAERYQRYMSVVDGFGNMKVEQCYVDKSLKDIEKKLTENRYHVNRNRNGEKQAFFRKYNTTAWQELPSEEKAMHAARACQACMPSCLLHVLDFTKNPTPTPTPTPPRICLETSINKPWKVLEFKAFLISLVQNQIW